MSLISNGITSVRAIAMPAGIWPDGTCIEMPQMVLVKWRSDLEDYLYQVYVNGKFAGATIHHKQRQMIVPVPSSFNCGIRIEVFAVEPEYADLDLSYELTKPIEGARVRIVLSRNQNLPEGGYVQIYYDNAAGQIDYENPINESPIRIWPAWQDKSGFAMSMFGYSDFGYDSSGAIGFAKGCFGIDEFGIDFDTIVWESPELSAGIYKFAIVIFDKEGNQSSSSETEPISVIPQAKPANMLEVISFDTQSNQLILKIA